MRQLIIFLLVITLFACKQNESPATPPTPTIPSAPTTKSTSVNSEEENADVYLPFDIALKDADGKDYNSKDIFKNNGKPTVLMFWLTTCGPCHRKLKAIKPLYPQWKDELDFNAYAISGDFPKNFPQFQTQVKSKNWEWETYNDVSRGFRKVLPGKLNGYPQTFIFDKKGKLVYQDRKYRTGDEHRLYEKIKEICNS